MYVGMEAPADSENWVQDPDVLDTWFSSACGLSTMAGQIRKAKIISDTSLLAL